MKAIILNSGEGKRMGDLTAEKPKCMVKLNEETLLSRQLRILKDVGIDNVVITTGPHEGELREHADINAHGLKIEYVHNPVYDKTNYIYSLYLVKDLIDDDILLMHGDLLFSERVLETLMEEHERSVSVVSYDRDPPEKDFKAVVDDGKVKRIGVDIQGVFFQPLYLMKKDDFVLWMKSIESFVGHGNSNVYAEDALNPLLDSRDVLLYAVDIIHKICMEIDDVEDLEKARGLLDG